VVLLVVVVVVLLLLRTHARPFRRSNPAPEPNFFLSSRHGPGHARRGRRLAAGGRPAAGQARQGKAGRGVCRIHVRARMHLSREECDVCDGFCLRDPPSGRLAGRGRRRRHCHRHRHRPSIAAFHAVMPSAPVPESAGARARARRIGAAGGAPRLPHDLDACWVFQTGEVAAATPGRPSRRPRDRPARPTRFGGSGGVSLARVRVGGGEPSRFAGRR
jgi:hypothetical protein